MSSKSISELPDELLVSVFSILSQPITISKLSKVSSKFNRIASDPRVWSNIYFHAWSRESLVALQTCRNGDGNRNGKNQTDADADADADADSTLGLTDQDQLRRVQLERRMKWKRELKSEAKAAWESTLRKEANQMDEDNLVETTTGGELNLDFIDSFSGGIEPSTSEKRFTDRIEGSPDYKQLFISRLNRDKEILSLIKNYILFPDSPILSDNPNSRGRIRLAEVISNSFGMEAYDVLTRLVDSQERVLSSQSSISPEFPSALQLLSFPDQISRSPSYHLALLDLSRSILEHLLRREGMEQMDKLRLQELDSRRPRNQEMNMGDLKELNGTGRPSEIARRLYAPINLPQPEEALLAFSSFRGASQLFVRQQLDSLAVACYLYLRHEGIELKRPQKKHSPGSALQQLMDQAPQPQSSHSPKNEIIVDASPSDYLRNVTKGISSFMTSQGFTSASSDKFHDLDNHFLNLALLPQNRENLPLTLVSIFCSLANRLGLFRASTANFPGRIHCVCEEEVEPDELEERGIGQESDPNRPSTSTAESVPVNRRKRFWIDVFAEGTLVTFNDLCDMLGNGLGIRTKEAHKFLDPARECALGMRIARNIGTSVERAQGLPRIIHVGGRTPKPSANSETRNGSRAGDQTSSYERSRENRRRFYYDGTRPDQVFLEGLQDEEAPVLLNRSSRVLAPAKDASVLPARATSWSDYDQRVSMYACAHAFIRLFPGETSGRENAAMERPSRRILDWMFGMVADDFLMDVPSIERDLLGLSLFESVASNGWTANGVNPIPNLTTLAADEDEGSDSGNEEGEDPRSIQASLLFRTPAERTEWGNLLGELRRSNINPEIFPRFGQKADVEMRGREADEVLSDSDQDDSFYDALDEGPDASPRIYPTCFENGNPRSLILPDPVHRVGTVFTHRVYGYLGVILGWSRHCNASESWQRSMGVDNLPEGGRNQPFYNILADDGSKRFVAQCNIVEVVPSSHPGLKKIHGNGQGPATWTELAGNEGEWENLPRTKTTARLDPNIKRKVIENENQLAELSCQRGIGQTFRCVDVKNACFKMSREGSMIWPDDN